MSSFFFSKKIHKKFKYVIFNVCNVNKNKQTLNITRVLYTDLFTTLKLQGIFIKKTAFYSYNARFNLNTTITKERLVLSFPVSNNIISIY